jgi:dephospho-CoA kinase
MRVLGLTGGAGAGKSTVSSHLASLGARVIDADQVAREVTAPGTPAWKEILSRFGPDSILDDGRLNRPWLRRLVFFDSRSRRELERITHPRIVERVEEVLEGWRREGFGGGAVLEAALLIELGLHRRCHRVWAVVAPREERIERLVDRMGCSREEAEAILQAQMPEEEMKKWAHLVLENRGTIEELQARAEVAWRDFLADAS